MDPWVLTATDPTAGRLYLANGYMSTALDWSGGMLFESESAPCYIRGIYNGSGSGGIDRLAAIPCWSRLRYGAPGTLRDYRRELDLRRGTVWTCCTLEEERGSVRIEQMTLVSRAHPHQAIVRIVVQPTFDGEVSFQAGLDNLPPGDLATLEVGARSGSIWFHGRTRTYAVEVAELLAFPDQGWSAESRVGQNEVACTLRAEMRANEERVLTQLVRVCTELESDDPLSIVRQPADDYEQIRAAHEDAWDRLWQTDIEIEGDEDVQRFARAGLFYLWSSVREGDHWSIAPMGLSSNGYNGHIFWDAELWMYPPLLLTQPDMARACVAYRERTVQAARVRAASNGYRGAQFPWEGAFTGDEMTPTWAETRDFQLHITADVALGQWWYFLNTRDLDWLRQHGFPIIRECAEFWSSRVEYNADQDCYEISDVVCADEYAAHVDNDAFTNAAVRQSLLVVARAAELLGEPVPPEWRLIADKIYLPYDHSAGRHLEFEGYDGRVTKQADVELLAYPLEQTTDRQQIARDLDYYATVIDPNGPAMSFSVYAIVSAQLDRAADAYEYLKRAYEPNTRPPFQAFSETPTNNEFFFCTGVGGALQALLFGFSGLRLREGYVVLDPILPAHWQRLCLRNVYLLGARTDIDMRHDWVSVRRPFSGGTVTLELRYAQREAVVSLEGGGDTSELELQVADETLARTDPVAVTPGQPVPLPHDRGEGLRLRVAGPSGEIVLDVLFRQACGMPNPVPYVRP